MDFLSSKRFISITLAILIVLNLALLGTLWWQNVKAPTKNEKAVKTIKDTKKQSFFEKELNLTDEQSKEFNALRQQHFQGTLPALVTISSLKRKLIHEAIKAEPDTLEIKALAERIGSLQAVLEYRLAWHFNGLSNVCSPEQRDTLQSVLEKVTAKPYKLKSRLLLKRIRLTPIKNKHVTEQDITTGKDPDKQTEAMPQ
ncbi:periplasmic heavy metal sensor [Prosthecochloris sp. SCSIO W1101]|uniref:Spy/CpxP family protein refolding chaperone n=1 Tax=Prosthecochloris sp. SCSIO W1101 TaxID=2992242 RepID=UPI00223D7AAC|nr:periplasmic heavy metal sensor [Prosthecochloris sp. SCSIO W1101]UZJ41017.1 periplasmic heavy metal sensor [Prosthecochloris sp. SCSIO W1101]